MANTEGEGGKLEKKKLFPWKRKSESFEYCTRGPRAGANCRKSAAPGRRQSRDETRHRRQRDNDEDVENRTRRKWNETGEEWEQLDDDEQREGG